MSTQSHVSAYTAPHYTPDDGPIGEQDVMSVDDFESHGCVSIQDDQFDNFLIDLRELPPGVTHIHFWRG